MSGVRTTVAARLTDDEICELSTALRELLEQYPKIDLEGVISGLVDSLADAIVYFNADIAWKTIEVGAPPNIKNDVLMDDCVLALEKVGIKPSDYYNEVYGVEGLLFKVFRLLAKLLGIKAPKNLHPLLKHVKRGLKYKSGDRKITRNI